MALQHSPSIVTSGLTFCMDAGNPRSYPGSGTSILDVSGSGYTGVITASAASYSAGVMVYNGSNTGIQTNYGPTFTDFTIGVWFKDASSPAYGRIVDSIYNTGMMLMRNSSTANSWGGGIIEGAAPYGIFLTLTDGAWHYLVSVRSGTTHTLYGDGVTNTVSNTVSASALPGTTIGIGGWTGSSTPSQSFIGSIGPVQIYNRALSTNEILQNFNALRGRYGI